MKNKKPFDPLIRFILVKMAVNQRKKELKNIQPNEEIFSKSLALSLEIEGFRTNIIPKLHTQKQRMRRAHTLFSVDPGFLMKTNAHRPR